MNEVYGYGEDGLTLWLLKKKLNEVVPNKSDIKNSIVLYRPSIGRGKSYGEFDAIVGTPNKVYLIESKWVSSNRKVEIKDPQIRRHEIFKWYFENLREYIAKSGKQEYLIEAWNEFKKQYSKKFNDKFRDKKIPKAIKTTKLSRNIWFIIDKLKDCGSDVKNILLVFKDEQKFEGVKKPNGFDQVDIILDDIDNKGWRKL